MKLLYPMGLYKMIITLDKFLLKQPFNHSPAGSSHPTNSALEDNTSYADESISQLNEGLTIFRETSWEP